MAAFIGLTACGTTNSGTNNNSSGSGGSSTSVSSNNGSSPGSGVVVRIAGFGSISKAMLAHWLYVQAVVAYQEVPTGPAPAGVLPDPPRYTACVAFLRSAAGRKLVETGTPATATQLKGRCEAKLRVLTELTMKTLIGWDWTIAEGERLGIDPSSAEVRRRFKEVNSRLYPQPGEFARYLKTTGQTLADMLLRAKVQLFEVKEVEIARALEKHLAATLTPKQYTAAIARLVGNLPSGKAWVEKTTCQPGYVTADCSEYHGTQSPGL